MKTYYLVDFENVNINGLNKIKELSKDDSVVLFITKNACKLDVCAIANLKANLKILQVPAGKQSADMHIVSYLGYVIGSNNPEEIAIKVISKDNDYNGVIQFWKDSENVKITKHSSIAELTELNTTSKEVLKVIDVKNEMLSELPTT